MQYVMVVDIPEHSGTPDYPGFLDGDESIEVAARVVNEELGIAAAMQQYRRYPSITVRPLSEVIAS